MSGYYDHLLKTYGPQVAQRYLSVIGNYRDSARPPIRTERWISNRIHRQKLFTPTQVATIRSLHNSGESCRDLARYWGCSQGTISQVVSHRGSYR